MDKYAKLITVLKAAMGQMPVPFMIAEVVSVEGPTCTVQIGDLKIEEVRLRPNPEETAGQMLVKPKVGTNVLIGALADGYDDLCVVVADVAETITYEYEGLQVIVDGAAGKIRIGNAQTSVLALLNDLVSLIRNIKVNTPVGPSVGILPDTEAALQVFETKFKTLFN